MITIRTEQAEDSREIAQLISRAFEHDPISDHREADIVAQMRRDEALTVSLVAERFGNIVGHIAFSRVAINGEFIGWYGLAPVSVLPEYQDLGIGSKLVAAGLDQLKLRDAHGCVLLGEPDYYQRFGFAANDGLQLPDVPAQYFQALPFACQVPTGSVQYHSAFA